LHLFQLLIDDLGELEKPFAAGDPSSGKQGAFGKSAAAPSGVNDLERVGFRIESTMCLPGNIRHALTKSESHARTSSRRFAFNESAVPDGASFLYL